MEQEKINKDVLSVRRSMLPWWITMFSWIFMFAGGISVACLVASLFTDVSLSMYGFDATNSFSVNGMLITILFLFKGYVAYLLYYGKDDAIQLGKYVALLGLALSVASLAISIIRDSSFVFRLEILVLIGFYMWLDRNKRRWREAAL